MLKPISALAAILFASNVAAAANSLPDLNGPAQIKTSAPIEVNGQDLVKVLNGDTQPAEHLFAGDKLAKGPFNSISKATGKVFVNLTVGANAATLAADLGLDLVFTNGKTAVLKATDNTDLLKLTDALHNDSRVSASKLELVSNKHKPE